MNECETILIDYIDNLIRAGTVRKEVIAEAYTKERNINRADIQTYDIKKKIVDYLNGLGHVSNVRLTNWCKEHNFKCNSYSTLERCLRLGKFSYKTRRGGCIYYMKNGITDDITMEDIVL